MRSASRSARGRSAPACRLAHPPPFRFDPLERRLLLAYSATAVAIGGGQFDVTFTDSASPFISNELVLDTDADGFVRHNRAGAPGESFASPIDLNTGVAGVQAVHVSELSGLIIDAGTGNDSITLSPALTGIFLISIDAGEGNDIVRVVGNGMALVAVSGGPGNDLLIGSDGADNLSGGTGNDTLHGLGGNDTLSGGDDNDHIFAGTGINEVTDGAGNDLIDLSQNAVAVIFFTGGGNDTVLGTPFNDVITGSTGDDSLVGNEGNDTLLGVGGADQLIGGAGNDSLVGGTGADLMDGGSGSDLLVWNPGDGSDVLEGGSGDADVMLFNGSAGDEIFTFNANGSRLEFLRNVGNIRMDVADVEEVQLNALGGADQVIVNHLGGTGVSAVRTDLGAGDGASDSLTVNASAGADRIGAGVTGSAVEIVGVGARLTFSNASGETLLINGLAGNDVITVADDVLLHFPSVTLDGGAGDDQISGDGTLFGGPGNDVLSGGAGANLILGGDGRDLLLGWGGNDTLAGGNGSDTLRGGAGHDLLIGGAGVDQLFGDGGFDILVSDLLDSVLDVGADGGVII